MHQLLEEQLRRTVGVTEDLPPCWQAFIQEINATYRRAEEARALLEQALSMTSSELQERNEHLYAELNEGARIQERLHSTSRQQAAIATLSQRALSDTAGLTLLQEAALLVADTLSLPLCEILELDAAAGTLRTRAGIGWREGVVGRAVVSAERSTLQGFTLEAPEPVLVEDLSQKPLAGLPPHLEAHAVRTCLGVVIEGTSAPWGVLGAYGRKPRNFTTEDVNFIRTVAHVLGQAIERLHVADVLRSTDAKYRKLFERANVPILLFRPDDERILEVNPEACRTYGLSRDEFVGKSLKDITRDVERGEREIERILSLGNSQNFETVHLRKNGEPLDMLVSCSPIEYEGEQAILAFGRDITDRKRAERLLQEREAHLRALAEHATDLTAILDPQMHLRHLSGPVRELLGVAAAELQSVRGLLRIHPEDRRRCRRAFVESLRAPERVIEVEFRYRHGDGGWRHLSARGRSLIGVPGIDGVLLGVRDVTERVLFEEKLVEAKEQAEEMAALKSSFLANMSHEIRTPLTAILGFAEVLANEIDDERREFVDMIRQGGQRLSHTLNSVLDLARLEAGAFEAQWQTISVAAAIGEATSLFRTLVEQKGLYLRAALPETDLALRADPNALARILNNLLSNAIKFTERGGITVRVREVEGRVEIDVEDTGIGISATFLPHLFDEFKQESTGLSRAHEGTGLGLTITRRLAELLGGTIDVESDGRSGSTFRLSFPLADADVHHAVCQAIVAEVPGSSGDGSGQPEELVRL